jgi:hypothetical protein
VSGVSGLLCQREGARTEVMIFLSRSHIVGGERKTYGDGRFVKAPGLHGEVLKEDEALTVEEFGAHSTEERRHSKKGEDGGGDDGERDGEEEEGVSGDKEFNNLS